MLMMIPGKQTSRQQFTLQGCEEHKGGDERRQSKDENDKGEFPLKDRDMQPDRVEHHREKDDEDFLSQDRNAKRDTGQDDVQ